MSRVLCQAKVWPHCLACGIISFESLRRFRGGQQGTDVFVSRFKSNIIDLLWLNLFRFPHNTFLYSLDMHVFRFPIRPAQPKNHSQNTLVKVKIKGQICEIRAQIVNLLSLPSYPLKTPTWRHFSFSYRKEDVSYKVTLTHNMSH